MQFKKYIWSRGLPKTGQVVVAVGGDDATYQAGWWVKQAVANNRDRFVVNGEGDDTLIFDRATGLMWAGDGDGDGGNGGDAATWEVSLDAANACTLRGFSDWRIPNVKEIQTLLNYGKVAPPIEEPPFLNIGSLNYWSSTTVWAVTANAWYMSGLTGGIYHELKTESNYSLCVRSGI
ncbi:unnamed protein product [marine sediment metagenome]|uniref:Lcl C-terminal domain-containing protein n=1 Tax=marine sediment metagenome TaxID=412755 RepID=X1TDT7_9ZZZZ